MGRRVKEIVMVVAVAVAVMLAPLSSITWAEKPLAKPQAKEKAVVTEKAPVKPQAKEKTVVTEKATFIKSQTGDVILKIVTSAGKATTIDLENKVPVRGMQFTIEGMKLAEMLTTSRTKGFLVKFNEKNGIAILVSLTTEEIAPGKGPIAEVKGEKSPGAKVSLSEVSIIGRDRAQLYP